MHRSVRIFATGTALLAAAAAVGSAALGAAGSGSQARLGPGMMGGATGSSTYGPGMMGGAFGGTGGGGAGASGTAKPSAAQLTRVGGKVETWLASNGFKGFKVAEVMAFTNNDYVAVHDKGGKPAFELLTDLNTNWLMEEPPSMMWNTRYGVMGDAGSRIGPMMGGWMGGNGWNSWSGSGSGKVSTMAKAVSVANTWLAGNHPGERVPADAVHETAMGHFPGYYSFDTQYKGKTYGMLSVNATTGAVWYHGWHGAFLAEKELAS
jgi:hypothetical protein